MFDFRHCLLSLLFLLYINIAESRRNIALKHQIRYLLLAVPALLSRIFVWKNNGNTLIRTCKLSSERIKVGTFMRDDCYGISD